MNSLDCELSSRRGVLDLGFCERWTGAVGSQHFVKFVSLWSSFRLSAAVIKGFDHPKMKIMSVIISHPHVVPTP